MLQVEPAARKRRSQLRVALAMAGGGPLGAFYQLGCLHALADSTDGLDLTNLDGYVGVSSGAIIIAGLANGIDTAQMVQLFLLEQDGSEIYPLTPGMLMRPAFEEYCRRALRVPSLLTRVARNVAKDPLGQNWAAMLSPLTEAIPTGVFDNRPFERYLRTLLSTGGRTNDFRELRPMLRIIATDLNSGEEVRFGEPGYDSVPISEAIRASTALPGLYTPVRIEGRTLVDGALLRTAHASLALDSGADLVLTVNPLVTFSSSTHNGRHNDLSDGGFITVMNQTFRALIQSRMQIGMATYRQRYPFSDRLLFQPDRDDEIMFFTNAFRYSERFRLASHAYQMTRRDLLTNAETLAPLLKRHGITLRLERLRDRRRALAPRSRLRFRTGATADLSHTLQRLSHWLAAQ
ncbi:MAG TPA: patatin-like phospholipase family protein [Steroidobacter sp.]